MKLKLFAVEVQSDETLKVSFDVLLAPSDLEWVKEHLNEEVSLEDLQVMEG